MGKRKKSKKKRRKSKDETPEASVSIDLVEAEEKLEQEAHLRAQKRYQQLSQWTSLSDKKKKKKKKSYKTLKHDLNEDNDSSNIEEEEERNHLSNNDESDDDFGLYKVSYGDLQNNDTLIDTEDEYRDVQKSTQSTSPTASAKSASLSDESSSLELLSSPDKTHKRSRRKRKRKRRSLSFDSGSDLEFMTISRSPPKKRRKKNKTHEKKKKKKEKEIITHKTYNVFDDIDVSDSEINAVNLSGIMDNNTSMTLIDRKYESMINKIHAPIVSADEDVDDSDDDIDIHIMTKKVDESYMEEEKDDEQDGDDEEEVEEETILFKINHPPPKQEKKLSIKMKISQSFGSIIGPLENRFKMKVTLRFDGEPISDTCSPQQLIDEFDAEDGDLIDANYT